LRPPPIRVVIFLLVVALIGFADAAYLTVEHYRGVIPPCTVVSGCESVLTSSYSEVFGVPVALGGTVYYLIVLVGLFAYIDSRNTRILKWTFLFTVFGLLATLWFTYLQAFILETFCQYCLLSGASSTILFAAGMIMLKKYGGE
jgi:uncharacterized membrane protein